MGAPGNTAGPRINDTRWTIAWRPLVTIFVPTLIAVVIAVLAELETNRILLLGVVGAAVGTAVWYWGVVEVNAKYRPLIANFRDGTRSRVANETGGINVNSMYTFISFGGNSPPLVEPSRSYFTAHIIFGDTSVIINQEFRYDMRERTTFRGGEQAELFYDQISNVRSENYKNRQTLQISLSSGQVKEIPSTDPEGVAQVKSQLQQKMRAARR